MQKNPRDPDEAEENLRQSLEGFVDEAWYQMRYPDITTSEMDPLTHFMYHGIAEQRDPNRFFDSVWYLQNNVDIARAGAHPLLHYLQVGARELRWPNPQFDAAWYVSQHPQAASNPLIYHLRVGAAAGYPTEKPLAIEDYLPSTLAPPTAPQGVFVDAIVPVSNDTTALRQCLLTLITNRSLPLARIIVIDDASTDAALRTSLDELADSGHIHLIRNNKSLGSAAAINQGMQDAQGHDVIILHNATTLPPGWLTRLAGHAHADDNTASASALNNHYGLFGAETGHTLSSPATMTQEALDKLCQDVNAGRSVKIPAPVGAAVYIRTSALAAIGNLDANTFPDVNAALTDFALRASQKNWTHSLAWDCYIPGTQAFATPDAVKTLTDRHPFYAELKKIGLDDANPFRLTLNAALIRATRRPVILMVSHNYGGGIQRYIHGLIDRYQGQAEFVKLEGGDQVMTLSCDQAGSRATLALTPGRLENMVRVLKTMNVTRLHIHHLLKVGMDIRRLIHRLGVPFDVTVHDYFAICPQVNMVKWPESYYCREPDQQACNTCIAENNLHGARDIFSWRAENTWQFTEADRVICPSHDAKSRFDRYGLGDKAIVVPHEQQTDPLWHTTLPKRIGPTLRVVLLGVLAPHKGSRTVAAVAAAAGKDLSLHLIGQAEDSFPPHLRSKLHQTGPYQEADLPRLLREAKPHVIWLSSSCPETFSYTLSTAIETGLPIVATNLGSMPDRLAGRPHTWIVDDRASTQEWLDVFRQVRDAIQKQLPAPEAGRALHISTFYETDYLRPPARVRSARRSIVILGERRDDGALTARAYQRLLLPMDYVASTDHTIAIADPETVTGMQADVFLTHRAAPRSVEATERLITHARNCGATLIYDLDDDLANVVRGDPQAATRQNQAPIVRTLLQAADAVWLANHRLAARLAPLRPDAEVLETHLDERLWNATPNQRPFWIDPIRVLCMGDLTHAADFDFIEPVLTRLCDEYGTQVHFDILGMTPQAQLDWRLRRPVTTVHSHRSHAAFIHWITTVRPGWHIGLAPMLDRPANRCRTGARVLDYAALGLHTIASDVPAYRGSIADGLAGQLVPNKPEAWYAALSWAIRDQAMLRAGFDRARDAFLSQGTLASQHQRRRQALLTAIARTQATA